VLDLGIAMLEAAGEVSLLEHLLVVQRAVNV
jgi:hypothetical protein